MQFVYLNIMDENSTDVYIRLIVRKCVQIMEKRTTVKTC